VSHELANVISESGSLSGERRDALSRVNGNRSVRRTQAAAHHRRGKGIFGRVRAVSAHRAERAWGMDRDRRPQGARHHIHLR
jgi:hypothetical protein